MTSTQQQSAGRRDMAVERRRRFLHVAGATRPEADVRWFFSHARPPATSVVGASADRPCACLIDRKTCLPPTVAAQINQMRCIIEVRGRTDMLPLGAIARLALPSALQIPSDAACECIE